MREEPFKDEFGVIMKIVGAADRFLIVGHVDPDGDCVGSMLAISLFLRSLGKDTRCYAPGEMPERFMRLPGAEAFAEREDLGGFGHQAIFVVDSPTVGRTENLVRPGGGLPLINMDHHPSNHLFGTVNVVDEKAAAAAVIVFRFLETAAPRSIDPDVAGNLYLGILMDTGCFRFRNTNAEAMYAAGRLIEAGARAYDLTHEYFYMKNLQTLKLLAPVLESIEVHFDGRAAFMEITREMLERTGGSFKDSEGFVDYGASIDDVELIALFREIGDGTVRVSLRSRNHHDVAALAERYGGGGHAKAAGLVIEGTVGEAKKMILEGFERLIAEHDASAPEGGTRGEGNEG
ncbi:MAG: bifunctional oligoribonuclease/PAP phosphatase NrnA [Candidatus Krumholzibacteria bacterium]|jgi:phosphoesterase RecJ-like protein|nr:bifunctional oligoribonuclease/PAP phosphatase NrnA [Candidatus Krumholzibacteria bacterium]